MRIEIDDFNYKGVHYDSVSLEINPSDEDISYKALTDRDSKITKLLTNILDSWQSIIFGK